MGAIAGFRSFGWPSRMLMINQFGINLGFYMLMPYLAGYLAGPMGLAAGAVGLVLGVRIFSQRGMFIIGGSLADRLGYKPLIVAGCLLRTAGFGGSGLPGRRLAAATCRSIRCVQRLLPGHLLPGRHLRGSAGGAGVDGDRPAIRWRATPTRPHCTRTS